MECGKHRTAWTLSDLIDAFLAAVFELSAGQAASLGYVVKADTRSVSHDTDTPLAKVLGGGGVLKQLPSI